MDLLLQWIKLIIPILVKIQWWKKPRLLVVEDNDNDAFLIQRNIEMCGYKSDREKTAEAGYALLKSNKYPLVFLDLMLPHEDGVTMAMRIREEMPKVIICICTGSLVDMEGYPAGPGFFYIKKNGLEVGEAAVRDLLSKVKL